MSKRTAHKTDKMPVQGTVTIANPAFCGVRHSTGPSLEKGQILRVLGRVEGMHRGVCWRVVKVVSEPAKPRVMRHERSRWGRFTKIAITGSLA